MDSEKWHQILIEWVNCLNLSNDIEKIDDLKSGDFFMNLQKVIKKSADIENDVLTFVFDLLNQHYPNYTLENKTNVHLSDLPVTDLACITSLLMHYTCIYDRRDVLTSPLCYDLSQNTQVSIRSFLQKVNRKVSSESLNEIVNKCINNTKLSTSCHWLSGGNSPSTKQSPLQDILKTPAAKSGKLQEKDREICRLRGELELEKYEKADLLEELKVQVNKNKKFELQLAQKSTEISRLRGEVVALENRTPPHYQDQDSREIQRRLRAEIQDLELYIQQIDLDLEKARKEKDTAKELARNIQSQLSHWQEKCLLTENNLESVVEHSKELETKHKNLQIHCNELEALLEEFRSKSNNESFIEESFQTESKKFLEPGPSCEDLAHSVVEVQLRDVEKLNEALENEKESLSNMLKTSEKQYAELKSDNEILKEKLTDAEHNLIETKNKLEDKLKETLKLEKYVETCQKEIQSLKDLLFSTREELNNSTISNKKLENDLENLNTKSCSYLKEINKLKEEIEFLDSQLDDTKKEQQECIERNELLDCTIKAQEDTLKEKDAEIKVKRLLMLELEESVEEMKQVNENDREEINTLTEMINELEDFVKEKDTKINICTKEIEVKMNQIAELEQMLNVAKMKVKELETDVKTSESLIADLKNEVVNLKRFLRELHENKKDLEECLNLAHTEYEQQKEHMSALQQELEKLEVSCSSLKQELENSRTELKLWQDKAKNFQENLVVLTNDNLQLIMKSGEQNSLITELEEKLQTEKLTVKDLKNETNTLKKNEETNSVKLETLKKENQSLQENIKSLLNDRMATEKKCSDQKHCIDDLLKKLSRSEDTITEMRTEFCCLNKNLQQKEEEIQKLGIAVENSTKEYEEKLALKENERIDLAEKLIYSQQDMEGKVNVITSLENVLSEKTERISELENMISEVSQEHEHKLKQIKEFMKKIDDIESDNVSLRDKNSALQDNVRTLENRLKDCEEKYSSLQCNVQELEKTLHSKEIQIEEYRKNLEQNNASIVELEEKLATVVEDNMKQVAELEENHEHATIKLDEQNLDLKKNLNEMSNQVQFLEALRYQNDKKIFILGEELRERAEILEKTQSEADYYKAHSGKVESLIQHLKVSLQESALKIAEMKTEIMEYCQGMKEILKVHELLEAKGQCLKDIVIKVEGRIKEKEGKITGLEKEVEEKQVLIDISCSKMENLKQILQIKEDELHALKNSLKEVTLEIVGCNEIVTTMSKEILKNDHQLEKNDFDTQIDEKHEDIPQVLMSETKKLKQTLTNVKVNVVAEIESKQKLLEDAQSKVEELQTTVKNNEDETANLKNSLQKTALDNSKKIVDLNEKIATNEKKMEDIHKCHAIKVAEIRGALEKATSELDACKRKISRLNEEIDEKQKKIIDISRDHDLVMSEKEKEVAEVRDALEKTTFELDACRKNILNLNEEINKKQEKMEEIWEDHDLKIGAKEKEIRKVSDVLEMMTFEVNACKRNILSLNEEINKKEEKIEEISRDHDLKIVNKEMEIKEVRDVLEKTTSELDASKRNNSRLNEDISKKQGELEGILEDRDLKIAEKEKEIREVRDALEKTTSELDACRKNISSLNEEINKKKERIEEILEDHGLKIGAKEKQIRKVSEALEMMTSELNSCKMNVLSLNEEINKKQEKIEEISTDHDLKIANREMEIEGVRDSLEKITSELDACKGNNSRLNEDISKKQEELEEILGDRDMKIAEKEKEIMEVRDALEKATSKLGTCNRNISNLNEEVCNQQEKIEKISRHYELKLAEKEKEVQTLNTEAENMKDIVTKLNNDHKILCEETKTLNVEYEELNVKYNELKTKFENVEKAHSKLLDDNTRLNTLADNLMEKCLKYESNLVRIKNALSSKNDELASIIENLKDRRLQNELDKSDNIKNSDENDHELSDLEGSIGKLNDYFKDLSKKEKHYLEEIQYLKSELDSTATQYSNLLQDHQEIKAESERQVKDLTENIHSLVESYNKIENEKRDFEKRVLLQEEELTNLKKLLGEKENLVLELDGINKIYKIKVDDLNETIQKLEDKLSGKALEINELKNNCQNLECSLDASKKAINKLESTEVQLSEQIDKLKDIEAQFNRDLKEKDNEITAIRQIKLKLERDFAEKDVELLKLKNKVEEATSLVNILKQQKESLESLLSGSKNENLKELEKIQFQYDAILSDHKSSCDNLRLCNEKLTSDLNVAQCDYKMLHEKYNTTLKEKQILEHKLHEKQLALSKSEKNSEHLRMNLNEQEGTITDLKNIIEDNLEIIRTLRNKNEQLSTELEAKISETQRAKRLRDEILESQTKIMKETESNIMRHHENAIEVKNDLLKRLEQAEKDRQSEREQRKLVESELQKVREVYGNVMTVNSKLEFEILNLRKIIDENKAKISEFSHLQEAYDKLLEENNKLMTEIDTVKYKRTRDREEFVSLLKKERHDGDSKEGKRIQEVRAEYEGKLERMKEKMLKLYREEVNKEVQKLKTSQNESAILIKTIDDLRNSLFDAEQKIHLLETERDMLRAQQVERYERSLHSSHESLQDSRIRDSIRSTISNSSLRSGASRARNVTNQLARNSRCSSSVTNLGAAEKSLPERKMSSTLPRAGMSILEEITVSRRTSINGLLPAPNLQMEDEEDDFNNKYLDDLKEGRCNIESGNSESSNRFSELAWRNSLVPPHLKSSYPAELQFVSPTHFKDDDIKAGNVELENSTCKLLPGEKAKKKDFGTTSYKKPGPPTPSKNGGRTSLQGNEVQPLREHNENKTPKRVLTPSGIKALFKGRNTTNTTKDNSENLATSPNKNPKQRLSIFRKPR